MHRQKNKRKNVVDVDDVYIDQQGSSKGKTGTLEDEMTILSRGFNSVAGNEHDSEDDSAPKEKLC